MYRWDLDRTYLETDLDSVRGLVRAALEDAASKRTVPGAGALLRGLSAHDEDATVCILSGSPTQMRTVLQQKLALDGVRVDRLILKDNLGNLRRGRLRAVRNQVGYKLPHLLEDRVGMRPEIRETLFGDDTETDALIYAAYAAAVAGRLEDKELVQVLEAGGAYPDTIERASAALRRIDRADAVEDIFIRVDRGLPMAAFRLLGPTVIPVFSWFQAALVLHARQRLSAEAVLDVARDVAARAGGPRALGGLVQDAVRRHLVDADTVMSVLDIPSVAALTAAARTAVSRMGATPPAPKEREKPDYIGFLRAVER